MLKGSTWKSKTHMRPEEVSVSFGKSIFIRMHQMDVSINIIEQLNDTVINQTLLNIALLIII